MDRRKVKWQEEQEKEKRVDEEPKHEEQATPITPHTNGKPVLKRSSSYSQFATNLLVVWSVNSDGIASALPRLIPIY